MSEALTKSSVATVRARLWDAGFRPVAVYSVGAYEPNGTPVKNPGKQPKGTGWQLRARHDPPDDAVATPTSDALNTGVLADGLRPIDIDIDDAVIAARVRFKAVELLGATLVRYRGNSGRTLLLYRAAEGVPKKRTLSGTAGKVEILGHGHHFVSHGVHPTGVPLEWTPESPENTTVVQLPAITEEQITALFAVLTPLIGAKFSNLPGPKLVNANGNHSDFGQQMSVTEVVRCLRAIPNNGATDWEQWNRIGMAVWAATGGSQAGKEAWSEWSAKNPAHDAKAVEERWANYRRSPPGQIGAGSLIYLARQHSRSASAVVAATPQKDDAEPALDTPEPEMCRQDGVMTDDAWMALLQRSDKGPRGNDYNVAIALEHAPQLRGKIAFDVRASALRALVPGPYGKAGPWTSTHSACLAIWLQGLGLPVRVTNVEIALSKIENENKFDPLEDYLLGLQWDGVERIGSWLTTYAGVEDSPTTSLIGSKFLIGAVARALKPGCQMDYALTLEGPQGEGKSTLIRILGGDYSSQSLPDFHSRDAQQIAGSSWIIEIADLAAVGRSALEQFKAFLTTTADSFVPKYERHKVIRQRWCVFILTVNPDGAGYLHDQTGNRRIWPVTVGTLDLEALRRDRDQLFAEAVACFERGDTFWPDTAEQRQLLRIEQDDRAVIDEFESLIENWATQGNVTETDNYTVASSCLNLSTKEFSKRMQMRIASCLKRLGFTRVRVFEDGVLKRKYSRIHPVDRRPLTT
jgi:predicted P-loop ATPase